MALLILLLSLFADIMDAPGELIASGIASKYHPWQKGPLVPYARYPGAWQQLPKPGDMVCATRPRYKQHRMRFGDILRLTYIDNGKVIGRSYCIKLDSGTYGACKPAPGHISKQCPTGYKFVIARRGVPEGGWYRSIVDATPAVHKKMHSPGWVWVKMERVWKAKEIRKKYPNAFK